jgi:hypothetical protein
MHKRFADLHALLDHLVGAGEQHRRHVEAERLTSRPYCFGETRAFTLALVTFTTLSGWCSGGVVITRFSDHAVIFRSSPTVFADTPLSGSVSTLTLSDKPPRAM